jgi:hypothetical protein
MPLVLILAAALSAAASPAPAAKAPSALACPDLQALARDRARPKAELRKLNQLPPADGLYAMLRTKDGCPDLTPVRLRR